MAHRYSLFQNDQNPNPNSGSSMLHQIGVFADTRAPTSIMNPTNDVIVPQLAIRDKNALPIKNVANIMRNCLPPNTKISHGAKEFVEQITSKFIRSVTKKANECCQNEFRRILGADDLLWAMKTLGFNNYYEYLNFYLKCYRYSNENESMQLAGEVPNPTLPTFQISHPTLPPLPSIRTPPSFSINPNPFMELDEAMDMDEVWAELDNLGVGSLETASTNLDPSL